MAIARTVLAVALATLLSLETGSAQAVQLEPDGYAVQLIALPSEQRLLDFVRDRGVSDLIATRVKRDGETHYVLLLGTYPDKQSAQTAASELPAALSDLSPWVRPLSGLDHF